MKTLFMISEENHGTLEVVCTSRKAAVVYLIESNWLTERTDYFDENADHYGWDKSVVEMLGHNWKQVLLDSTEDVAVFNEHIENLGFQVFEADFKEKEELL